MRNSELLVEIDETRARLAAARQALEDADEAGACRDDIDELGRAQLKAERELRELMNEAAYRAYAEPDGGPDRWL